MASLILLLDNGNYVVVPAEKVQLRQEPGTATCTLGFPTTIKNDKQEDVEAFTQIFHFPDFLSKVELPKKQAVKKSVPEKKAASVK